jgi:hypothetical protein
MDDRTRSLDGLPGDAQIRTLGEAHALPRTAGAVSHQAIPGESTPVDAFCSVLPKRTPSDARKRAESRQDPVVGGKPAGHQPRARAPQGTGGHYTTASYRRRYRLRMRPGVFRPRPKFAASNEIGHAAGIPNSEFLQRLNAKQRAELRQWQITVHRCVTPSTCVIPPRRSFGRDFGLEAARIAMGHSERPGD